MRALALAALLTIAAAPAEVLTIGGEAFPQGEIVDARAVGDGAGPAVLVTFAPVAALRIARITGANVGKPISIVFGGAELTSQVVLAPVEGGSIQISGMTSFPEAAAIAKRISGKDPLPESDGE